MDEDVPQPELDAQRSSITSVFLLHRVRHSSHLLLVVLKCETLFSVYFTGVLTSEVFRAQTIGATVPEQHQRPYSSVSLGSP